MTYTVNLENFNGPLDLLLHLIQQEEVEIHEIPLAVICDRYFEYMKGLDVLDVDVASEFLVMAATLMLIKSRSLLPAEEAVDLEEELDPRDELIQQLLEYKKLKLASRDLEERAWLQARVHPFAPPKVKGEQEIPIEEIDLYDLVKAFAALLRDTGQARVPRLLRSDKPLREYIEEVFRIVRGRGSVTFAGLFEGPKERASIIGRFLALLELIKRKLIRAVQSGAFGEIEIVLQEDRDLSSDEVDGMEAELLSPYPVELAELAEPPGPPGPPGLGAPDAPLASSEEGAPELRESGGEADDDGHPAGSRLAERSQETAAGSQDGGT